MKTIKFIILVVIVFTFSLLNGQVTDIDSNTYKTVKIGNQEWMAENLNVSHFRNGDPITEAKTDKEWVKAMEEKQPAWCYIYDIDPNGEKYGKLYNIYAICDSRGLAPQGYHIPSQEEWELLFKTISYVYNNDAGNKLKSTSGWQGYKGINLSGEYVLIEGVNGSNEFGFNALPNGDRNRDGMFAHEELHPLGYMGRWWCSSSCIPNYYDLGENRPISQVTLNAGGGFIGTEYTIDYGIGVRCLKD